MNRPTCACSRPITDSAYLCRDCTETMEKSLAEVVWLAEQLEATRTRQSRLGGGGIGIVVRGEAPIPWNDKAARVANDLHATLVSWVRHCEESQVTPELRAPADNAAALSRYLLASLPSLRHRPEVQECSDDLHRLTEATVQVINRAPDQAFYGPCHSIDYIDGEPDPTSIPCPVDLYGPKDALELTCGVCSTVHDLVAKRQHLLGKAQDQLVTAADLSKFLSLYGEPLTADRIRKWAERGLLVAHGRDGANRPLYRVSEAVERLSESTKRRTA